MKATKTTISVLFALLLAFAACESITTASNGSHSWTVTLKEPIADSDNAVRVEHTISSDIPLQDRKEQAVTCALNDLNDDEGTAHNAFHFVIYCFNGNGENGSCTSMTGIELEYYDAKLTKNGDNYDFDYINNWSNSQVADGSVNSGSGYTYNFWVEFSSSQASDFHIPTEYEGKELVCFMTNDFNVDAGSEWAYSDTPALNTLDTVMSVGISASVDVDGEDIDADVEVDATTDIDAEGSINTSSATGLVIGSVFTAYTLFTSQF